MQRNKLTSDMFNYAGAPTIRVEFARVSVNGNFYGGLLRARNVFTRTTQQTLSCFVQDSFSGLKFSWFRILYCGRTH